MATQPTNSDISKFLSLYDDDVEAAVAALREAKTQKRSQAVSTEYSSNPVIIEAAGLTKQYKVGKQKVEALRGLNLQIHEGEFVAFTGPSGSGKSTLLQMIGGLDKPSSGDIVVAGKNLAKLSDRKLSVFRGETIGFVFQFFYLQPFLNLQANLSVPGMFARTPRKERQAKVTELAEAVGLSERVKHLPKELSGGQMQRAAIARALLNKPKIILADEPTGNLDSANGKAIIELFEKVRTQFGTTIIVVTHDPAVAAHADREINLKDGVVT